MPSGKITPHFAWKEFAVSAQRPDLVKPVPDSGPIHDNVRQLATTVLEPLRVAAGQPISINSGYRSLALNRAIGGSPTSQHTLGQAADITLRDGALWLWREIMFVEPERWPTGQVILYPDRNFIHVALPNRKYPTPSYHIHCPTRGLVYQHVRNSAHADRLLRQTGFIP